jgi:hypothetical protein
VWPVQALQEGVNLVTERIVGIACVLEYIDKRDRACIAQKGPAPRSLFRQPKAVEPVQEFDVRERFQ